MEGLRYFGQQHQNMAGSLCLIHKKQEAILKFVNSCGRVRRTRLIILTYTYNLLYLQYTCSPRMSKVGSGFSARRYNTPPPSELGVVHEALRPMHMMAGACDSLWRRGWGCRKRRGVGGVSGTSRWWLHMSGLEAIQ